MRRAILLRERHSNYALSTCSLTYHCSSNPK